MRYRAWRKALIPRSRGSSSLHLLLHEDPRALAVGGRHAGLFPRFAALSPHMVLSLEKLGFIERTPGQGRSLKLLLPREQLPDLI